MLFNRNSDILAGVKTKEYWKPQPYMALLNISILLSSVVDAQ